mgnify:FL=1
MVGVIDLIVFVAGCYLIIVYTELECIAINFAIGCALFDFSCLMFLRKCFVRRDTRKDSTILRTVRRYSRVIKLCC